MKKKILLAAGLLVAGACVAQAQTQKGNGILGGGVKLGYGDSRYGVSPLRGKQTSFSGSLNGVYGRFVADNWMVGADVDFSRQSSRLETGISRTLADRDIDTYVSINPFVRRYWAVGSFLLFGGGGIQLSTSTVLDYGTNGGSLNNIETRTNQYTVRPTLEVGGTYFLSNRLALQGSISANSLPIPVPGIGFGLIYWTGPNGTGATNSETTLTTTNQGNWILEGGFGFNASNFDGGNSIANSEKNKTSTVSIQASIGRFIAKNTLLGVGLGLSTNTQKRTTASSYTNQTYSIAPYIQHYLSNRRLTPYLRGTVLYSSNRQTNFDQRIGSLQGSLGLGLAYLISNRFIVETSLANASYQFIEFSKDNRFRAANLSAQLGSGFSLRYVIAGRK